MSEATKFGKDIPLIFRELNEDTKKYLSEYTCGNMGIDDHFHEKAINDKSTTTFLFIDKEESRAITCVSLSCSRIDYVHSIHGHESTSAFEIKFFATDEDYQKRPYDENNTTTLSKSIMNILIVFLKNTCRKYIGATHIVLYSVPKAKNFYLDCGFLEFEEYMEKKEEHFTHDCIPMYMPLDY